MPNSRHQTSPELPKKDPGTPFSFSSPKNNSEQAFFKKKEGLFWLGCCLILVGVLFLTPLGALLKNNLAPAGPPRLLGVTSGAIHPKGPWVEVTKWQKGSFIEVRIVLSHFDQEESSEPFIQNFTLPQVHDGHGYFRTRLTNLAILNSDEDEWAEILVPFFESQLIPRLYVLKYDPLIKQFIRLNDRD
jgi:hypothetical protein